MSTVSDPREGPAGAAAIATYAALPSRSVDPSAVPLGNLAGQTSVNVLRARRADSPDWGIRIAAELRLLARGTATIVCRCTRWKMRSIRSPLQTASPA